MSLQLKIAPGQRVAIAQGLSQTLDALSGHLSPRAEAQLPFWGPTPSDPMVLSLMRSIAQMSIEAAAALLSMHRQCSASGISWRPDKISNDPVARLHFGGVLSFDSIQSAVAFANVLRMIRARLAVLDTDAISPKSFSPPLPYAERQLSRRREEALYAGHDDLKIASEVIGHAVDELYHALDSVIPAA